MIPVKSLYCNILFCNLFMFCILQEIFLIMIILKMCYYLIHCQSQPSLEIFCCCIGLAQGGKLVSTHCTTLKKYLE